MWFDKYPLLVVFISLYVVYGYLPAALTLSDEYLTRKIQGNVTGKTAVKIKVQLLLLNPYGAVFYTVSHAAVAQVPRSIPTLRIMRICIKASRWITIVASTREDLKSILGQERFLSNKWIGVLIKEVEEEEEEEAVETAESDEELEVERNENCCPSTFRFADSKKSSLQRASGVQVKQRNVSCKLGKDNSQQSIPCKVSASGKSSHSRSEMTSGFCSANYYSDDAEEEESRSEVEDNGNTCRVHYGVSAL